MELGVRRVYARVACEPALQREVAQGKHAVHYVAQASRCTSMQRARAPPIRGAYRSQIGQHGRGAPTHGLRRRRQSALQMRGKIPSRTKRNGHENKSCGGDSLCGGGGRNARDELRTNRKQNTKEKKQQTDTKLERREPRRGEHTERQQQN